MTSPVLDEAGLDADPIRQFRVWFDEAVRANVPQPEAMVLSTATPPGRPSARVVLMKAVDEGGFVFYTNYRSRKGRELEANPHVALTFFWAEVGRQVRIEGAASRLTASESEAYFSSRPRESQLGSLASAQSEPIAGREELDRRYRELDLLYRDRAVPRPSHWGGYRVKPESIEFWQTRFARLNDRILFTRSGMAWRRIRLQP